MSRARTGAGAAICGAEDEKCGCGKGKRREGVPVASADTRCQEPLVLLSWIFTLLFESFMLNVNYACSA